MEIITIAFIIILNIVAISIVLKSLGDIEIKNKIAITLLGVILMYVILYIIYNISSANVDKNIITASRQLILFTFLPINILCILVPILLQFKKLKNKEINEPKFKFKIILFIIIGIIILFIENMYIKDIQHGIENFNNNVIVKSKEG